VQYIREYIDRGYEIEPPFEAGLSWRRANGIRRSGRACQRAPNSPIAYP
jgi:hypothetical protein